MLDTFESLVELPKSHSGIVWEWDTRKTGDQGDYGLELDTTELRI